MLFLWQDKVLETSITQVSEAYTRLFIRVIDFIPDIISAALVILITMLLARIVKKMIDTAMKRTSANPNIIFLVVRFGSVLVWLVGMSVMLSLLKVNMAAIFAPLGLTGAAIGLAMNSFIANSVAGVVLLSTQPFKPGDTITIETYEGVVDSIAISNTILKTSDGKEVSIPNSKVFSAVLIKHTPLSMRRLAFSLNLQYETSFEEVKEIILAAIKSVTGVSTTPAPDVSINSFSGDAVVVDIRCWIEQDANFAAINLQVKLNVKAALDTANITIAPTTTTMLLPAQKREQKEG